MKTGGASIVPLPERARSKEAAALGRDVDSLIGVFRELHEVEVMTGRAGLAARVRVCVMDVLASADKIAREDLSQGQSRGRARL